MAFGLTTATPLQRALCRTLDGGDLGDLATHPDVLEAFGKAPTAECRELVLLGGIRGAKSLIAAAAAVRCTQRVDLSGPELRASDVPRVSICSLDIDKARVVLNDHLIGTLERSPFLRAIFVDKAEDGIFLRHPSGRPVEIAVSAGKRAGGNLVSRWSAGCIFDEAGRMTGANDGVVNLEHARTSVMGRLLPGSMLILPTSPWAPFGPVYVLTTEHWSKPTAAIAVAKCRGPLLNPSWWTPERCEQLRNDNPDSYTTDVECNFMTPVTSLLSEAALKRAAVIPDEDQPFNPLASYVAAMDPATRSNAWTLTIATREDEPDPAYVRTSDDEPVRMREVHRTVAHREWRGSSDAPLSIKATLREVSSVLQSYGLNWTYSDQYYIDSLQEDATDLKDANDKPIGFNIVQFDMTQEQRAQRYLDFRAKLVEGKCKLHANAQMRSDLLRVARHATAKGINIVLPKTADGRHCDYAPSVVLAMTMSLDNVRRPEPVEDRESRETRERTLRKLRGNEGDWT